MSESLNMAKIVVYDLESENMRIFQNESVKDKVRSARVRCLQWLHSLGVGCTESVVLVPSDRVQRIQSVVERVNGVYERLNEELRASGFMVRLRPIIEVLDLTQSQTERLLPLAHRRLLSQLDRAIEHVSQTIDMLAEVTEEVRVRRVRANLRRLASSWRELFAVSQRLGLDISRDYNMLVELIDEALRRSQ